jgi:hypothetical protein
VDLDEADLDAGADLEDVDLDDFGGLDADDAGLQAALTVLAVLADDISDVAELAVDVDGPDGPEAADEPDEPEPGLPSAEADAGAEGPGAAGALVVKLSPDGGEDGLRAATAGSRVLLASGPRGRGGCLPCAEHLFCTWCRRRHRVAAPAPNGGTARVLPELPIAQGDAVDRLTRGDFRAGLP